MRPTNICYILVCSIGLVACVNNELPTAKELSLTLPDQPFIYSETPGFNNSLPTLGRVLFYDRQLSINNSISCSSCHKQELGFSDKAALSVGFESQLTRRNSMPIQNLGLTVFAMHSELSSSNPNISPIDDFIISSPALFWDGREHSLNIMVLKPIVNHVEMGIFDVGVFTKKISSIPYYHDLFTMAFGSPEVTPQKIADALTSFVGCINSNNTRLDQFLQDRGTLSPNEMLGFDLFRNKYDCNSCHQVQQPNGYIFAGKFANIGLDPTYADNGVQDVTGQPSDAGKFKIPSLRNVALTAPYMHDGRFATLGDVVDHYKNGIANHPNLDSRLRNPDYSPRRIPITNTEKEAIVAFLKTLTDEGMIHDQRLSDPFKVK